MTRRPRRPPGKARKVARKPARRRTPPADALDAFIADGARMLGLQIKTAWLPAVRAHLQVTLQHGARVMDFSLPDDSEPAAVFKA